jgi:hypothetical protein
VIAYITAIPKQWNAYLEAFHCFCFARVLCSELLALETFADVFGYVMPTDGVMKAMSS